VPAKRSNPPLKVVSTVDAIVEALRERVFDGTLSPGTPLREAELCADFGVSRHSLRTALLTLVHEGLLRHEPNKGVSVPEVELKDVGDLYLLRTALETEAAVALMERGASTEKLEQAIGDLRALADDAPWQAVLNTDLRFHRALVDSVQAPRLSRMFESLLVGTRYALCRLHNELADVELIVAQHEPILEAIQQANRELAVGRIRCHLSEARDNIMELVSQRDAGLAQEPAEDSTVR
jgi:DNA-binding GntR family transcriptional regulator